jgi:formylglycine-generating enzyme required for sulfatase activity
MSNQQRRAILIAASEFPEEPSLQTLRCPKNDVTALAEALTSAEFGLFTDPLIFVNEPSHSTQRAINRVFKQAGRDDQILIYYSGHGKQDFAGHLHLATADTEADALETSSIAVGTLRRLIDNHACKQVALILDCCFGGAVGKDFLKSGVDDHLKLTFDGRGIYILTASTATQTAREKEGDQYSLFTKHILQGIRQGEADHDDDGLISLDDLYEYVKTRVPREAPQYPTKWEFGVQGTSLFIARAVRTFSAERLLVFKEKILGVEKDIDDDVFEHAYRVIKENQPKRDKDLFALLDDLCEGRLSPGKFSGRWLKLTPARPPEQEKKAPPPQQPEKKAQSPAPAIVTPPQLEKKAPPRKQVESFTDDLNGVPLEMIYVPGGSFKMGSPEGEGYDNERPQHDVTVPGFYIGKYQVTQAQWEAVMGKNPSHFKGDPALPVESVSWNDAKEFCEKLAQMTSKAYRLPSEAEWEYACRAGTTGDHAGDLDAMAWYDKISGNKTHPVGQKQPNAFGLYDMHGNVWEWCEDVWHDSYKDAPSDGSAWLSGGDSSRRMLRGGSFITLARYCRSAFRSDSDARVLDVGVGFRVVVSARTM